MSSVIIPLIIRLLRRNKNAEIAFPSEDAIIKQIYLATINANAKWQSEMFGWKLIRHELNLYFGDRFLKADTLN